MCVPCQSGAGPPSPSSTGFLEPYMFGLQKNICSSDPCPQHDLFPRPPSACVRSQVKVLILYVYIYIFLLKELRVLCLSLRLSQRLFCISHTRRIFLTVQKERQVVLVSFLMIIHRVERGSDFAPDFEFGLQSQDEIPGLLILKLLVCSLGRCPDVIWDAGLERLLTSL